MAGHHAGPTRRAALRRLSAGAGALAIWPYVSDKGAAAFARIQRTGAPPELVFLSPAQYAAVEHLAETIIPADDHSPGAREARVADYIDILLGESPEDIRTAWVEGLAAIDRTARDRFGAPLAELSAGQAATLVGEISRNEGTPQTPQEQFFAAAKDATIRGYYTSEIGIHQDLNYQGNRFLAEFVGCTHPEHGYEPRE